MRLHGDCRSTAPWRVRIAMSPKGGAAPPVAPHLRRSELVQTLKAPARLRAPRLCEEEATGWARPTLADLCLVPQIYHARRVGADVSGLGRLLEAEAAASTLPAIIAAAPERQPDAE
jgi:hypothetical protein